MVAEVAGLGPGLDLQTFPRAPLPRQMTPALLTVSVPIGAQVWCCLVCGLERQWGWLWPLEKSDKRLRCEHCQGVTLHGYFEVAGARA